jgi:protein-export membrane protein SecD
MQHSRAYVWFVMGVCLFAALLALPSLFKAEDLKSWPGFLPKSQVVLGLDLQGGSHLLLEVKTGDVIIEAVNNMLDAVRANLRKNNATYTDLRSTPEGIQFNLTDGAQRETLLAALEKDIGNDATVTVGTDGKAVIALRDTFVADRKKSAIEQSIEVVRRRVDETGTREPTIVRQGEDRILVQLPGEGDPERLKRLLGKTAKLTFQLVDMNASVTDAKSGRLPGGSQLLPADEREGYAREYVVKRQIIISGDMLVDAQPAYQDNQPVVSFRFDSRGANRFAEVTSENVGKPFAIILDGKVISAPVIRSPIVGGSGIISGNFTTETARDLALLLRAGALPAPLTILEERSVGAELGRDSIENGKIAAVIGFLLVSAFMVLTYGRFGIYSVVALVVNIVFIFAALATLGAALTLPGIAGLVLTIGMAVDANVLIFERIREELRAGLNPSHAVQVGFKQATATIWDTNLTTLIASLFLFIYGSGPVKGFAATLAIGIIASMFTAVVITRLLVDAYLTAKRPKLLRI